VSLVDNSDKYNFKNPKLHLTTYKNLRRSYIFFYEITLEIIICIFYYVKNTKIVIIAKIEKSLEIAKNCIIKLNRKTK
jgi:hypothetical protein